MKKNSMRLLGFLLAAVMMVSLFGLGVFAEDTAVADLAQLNAALDAGNTAISVTGDITVEDLEIPAGVTVTIAEGKTLRVLGTLDNQGAIEGAGTVSVAVMVYVVETRTPFEGVSYDVRATKNGSVTGNAPAAAVKYEISLDGGNTWIADTTNGKAQAVTVKTDGTTVVSSSFQSAFTSALSGETVHMLKDVHVQSTNSKKNNGPLRSYYGLILEGNGHTIFTDLESSGASNEYATIKFTSYLAGTGPDVRPVLKNVTIDSQKNAKADLDLVSGDVTFTVSLFNVNLLGNCQYASFAFKSPAMIINKSNVEIYDSTIPSWDAGSANAINFYSGSYNLSFNSKCTMYGGDYSKDPTNYVAEGYEVETKDDGRYYVQKAVTYVAQIGDTKYETLQDAIDKAEPGDTIEVLENIDLTKTELQVLDGSHDTYFLVEDKSITIDLKGKVISGEYTGSRLIGVFSTDKNGALTLTGNGTVDVTATGTVYTLITAFNDGSSVVIENGTYKLDKASDSLIYYGGKTDAEVIVKGGTFELGNVGTGENGKPWIFNVYGAGDHHVLITGGTFNADVNRQHWANEAIVAETCYMVKNDDGTWTVKDGAVAHVATGMLFGPYFFRKNVGYATIEEAFAAAVTYDDVNITLLQNVALTKDVEISIPGIVLNANGFALDCNGYEIKLTAIDATFTASEGLNVTTNVAGMKVVYEEGTYKVVPLVYVAQIGDTKYETLADAIAAANAAENGATITLLADATVDGVITISKDVIIEGDGKTITWADGYNGTIFNVESGVSVTLKDLTIDGENSFTFYDDTTTVENGQNWYTRFVDVGEEDKAINDNVIVNAGNLTLNGVTIKGVTIASDGDNGKTANTETGGFYLMYNDDLALIKSNGGKVTINGGVIMYNAGMVLNAINAETSLNTNVMYNMGAGNKGGIITANGGTMDIKGVITYNKAMARSATILGVINGAEVTFDAVMNYNEHIGVGSNTAGAMIVLEGASQFVMNGGTINYNEGGRAGAIASRWVGDSYGQHEDTSIVLNAGSIIGNTASNDSWNGASIFLRSPATIGEGMTIDGTIAVNAAPGALEITGGTFNNFDMIVTDGLTAEITGGTFDNDPTEWVAEGYATVYSDGFYTVKPVIAEIFFSAFGGSETSVTYPGFANSLQELVDYYMLCNNANEIAIPGLSAGDYTPVLVIYGGLSAEDVAYLGGASTDGTYVSAKPMTWTVRFADGVDASNNIKAAEGYVKIDNDDGTITIQKAVAKVGDTYFATLQDAFAACTNGETITLLVDLVYDADDVVPAHGGATGFGNYDQYNPSIIYIGGTKGATDAENQPSNVNAVLDLNGHTITNNADAYLFLFMDNCKVTIKDSKDGDGIIGNTEAPVIWVTGTDTLVTIENGKYTTVNAEGLLWSTHGGDLVIKGGEFSTSADDASLLIVRNAQDRRNPNYFIDGKATVTIYGGTYYGFDPEKMMDDSTDPFTEFDACADGYKSIKNGNAYTVENYVEWIKEQLLLGNDVVLEKDIVVDGSMIESIPAPTNGNGRYPNYGIFNVVGDYDVTFDLNGHSITYNGHKEFQWNGKTINSCTAAHGLFFANDGAHLTIVGEGDVIVNGVASGVYSASPDTAITIQGGNWVNNGCAECGATNLFLYASHGGELYIEGGRFEQALDSEGNSYLIVVHGGEYKNSVIDFAKTKIVVTGGTFVGMDPSKAHYFQQTADNKLVTGETVDTVPMGYRSSISGTIDGVDVYDVVELKATVEAGDFTYFFPGVENVDNVQELTNFYFLMQNAVGWFLGYDYEPVLTLYAELTDEVVLGNTPSDDTTVTLPETVTWTIVTNGFNADLIKAAEGYVKIDNGDGTITIQKAVAKIGDTYFATLQEAIDKAKDDDEIVVLVDIKLGWNDTVNTADGKAVLLNVEGKNITLNLNGKTITVEHMATEAADRIYVVVLVADGAGLTVIGDGAIDVTANETTPRVAYLFWKRGTTGYLVIEGGEYHMNHTEDSMVYTNGSDIVTVKGGSFTLDSIGTSTNGSPWIFNAQGTGGKHILITGGTFNADINRQHWSDEAVVDKTCYVVNNGDGTWTVKAGAVAYVNTGMTTGPYYAPKDIGYETIEEAFAAAVAANDSPITLLKNVMLKQNILISNSIELVPDGYTLDCGDYAIVLTDAAATLTAPEGLNVTTNVAGMKVVYEDGTYKVVPLVYVAQIGDTKYETLAEAILYAQPGDTIILLANVSEDVTINESITLDGAYFEYTGNITVQGNNNDISVVIKKVNFGNGTSYAVTTSRIKSITIEDCTVTGRSLLYAKHSTPSIVVKNVTVTGGNYVANITYGSEAYFENVQAIGMTGYGIFTQNYGAKTITLKNCSFDTPKYSSIAVRDDRTSSIDTFIFEGNNVMTSLRENEHTKYVLADVDATLAAPEGYTVTTDLDHYKVVYEDGVYKVALKGVVVLKTEGSEELKYFDTIAAAMAEAGNTAGTDLIYLIADHTESVVLVYDGTTLDVQDKTLTADYLVVFKGGYLTGKSYSATRASGTIKIDKNRVIIAEGCYADATSALLPIWNQATSSYVFGRYLIKNDPAGDSTLGAEVDENGNLTVDFKVQVNGSTATFMTGDTYENHGVSFRVVAEWTANGVKTIKSYVYTDEMVQECFGGNKSFRFTLAGATAIENLTVKLQVVSDTGSVVEVIQTLPESSNQ